MMVAVRMSRRKSDGMNKAILQEHLGPETVFSRVFFSQVQLMADFWPHEQVACWAQTQLSPFPQQVLGLTMM